MPKRPPIGIDETPEFENLYEFVVERTKDVTSPLSTWKLGAEFRKHTQSRRTSHCVNDRIQKFSMNIHKMINFDVDTKVRVIFACSAPVDYEFLFQLKKQAEIELDNHRRIIKYKKNGGGLELEGEHSFVNPAVVEREQAMLQFLADKTKTSILPIMDNQLMAMFKKETEAKELPLSLQKMYRQVKKGIYESEGFDEVTKIKMLFGSNAKVPNYVLEKLRSSATVTVDDQSRITEYTSNDGSLELKCDRSRAFKVKVRDDETWKRIDQRLGNDLNLLDIKDPKKEIYEEELADLIEFLMEKSKNAKTYLQIREAFKEYSQKTKGKSTGLYNRLQKIRSKIEEFQNFEKFEKLRFLFALRGPVSQKFLDELGNEAMVEVDEEMRITKYEANDGSLELIGNGQSIAKKRKI